MKFVDYIYRIVADKIEGLDSVYEDYIIRLVGEAGLTELRSNGYLEACGVLNGRQLYVLVKKGEDS